MFEHRSAIQIQLGAGGRDGSDGRRALRLSEVRGWHLAQLAVFEGCEPEFASAVEPLLGVRLPATAAVAVSARGRIFCTAPDQYWVMSGEVALMAALALAVPPGVGAVTLLSHARVRLAIAGAPARALLAKGIAIDLDPEAFPVGHAVNTGLHHNGVLLEHTTADRYELYVPRAYAVSIWEWLVDAALEFGYDVGAESSPMT